jgi:hypothetical protein
MTARILYHITARDVVFCVELLLLLLDCMNEIDFS